MATEPQFYLDKVLEVSTSERPAVLDWSGGINEGAAPPVGDAVIPFFMLQQAGGN